MANFEVTGVLPPGIHEYSYEEFIEQFVASFKASTTRGKILEGFIIFINNIMRFATPTEMWLDGSFITTKTNPNDIDFVMFFDPIILNAQWNNIERLLINSKMLLCDAYVVANGDLNMRSYWRGWFTFDRQENPKGIIRVNPNDFANKLNEVVRYVK